MNFLLETCLRKNYLKLKKIFTKTCLIMHRKGFLESNTCIRKQFKDTKQTATSDHCYIYIFYTFTVAVKSNAQYCTLVLINAFILNQQYKRVHLYWNVLIATCFNKRKKREKGHRLRNVGDFPKLSFPRDN